MATDTNTPRGFLRDLSPDAQARRARKAKSPWRGEPAAGTRRAQQSGVAYKARGRA